MVLEVRSRVGERRWGLDEQGLPGPKEERPDPGGRVGRRGQVLRDGERNRESTTTPRDGLSGGEPQG